MNNVYIDTSGYLSIQGLQEFLEKMNKVEELSEGFLRIQCRETGDMYLIKKLEDEVNINKELK